MLAALFILPAFAGPQAKPATTGVLPQHCLRVIETGCGKVHDVDVSPDGERTAVACENGHALVYALTTGELQKDLFDKPGTVTDVEFDPQGERLVAVTYTSASLWNTKTFEHEHTVGGQKLGMLRARFSPDGRSLATGACGNGAKPDEPTEVRVWDAATGTQVALFDDAGYRALPTFSPDGKELLLSTESKPTAFFFRIDDQHVLAKMSGHASGIAASTMSPDGKIVLTVSADFSARTWSAETGRQLQVLQGHSGYVTFCEFSPDGKEAATTSWVDRTTRVWNVKTGKQRLLLEGHAERPTAVHFAPDGRSIASADAAGHGLVFELEHGKIVARLEGHEGLVSALEFTPDSKRIVTSGYDGSVRVWANPLAK